MKKFLIAAVLFAFSASQTNGFGGKYTCPGGGGVSTGHDHCLLAGPAEEETPE